MITKDKFPFQYKDSKELNKYIFIFRKKKNKLNDYFSRINYKNRCNRNKK